MSRSLFRNHLNQFFFVKKDREWSLTLTHLQSLHKSTPEKDPNPSSSTISYLINSCGLSPQSAVSASEKISIKTTKKPDRLLNTLKSYGFDDAHIAKLITKRPSLLLSKVDTNIKPKLDYYHTALGCSYAELAALLSSSPSFLMPSLDKKIKPNYELLRPILTTDQQAAIALRRCDRLLQNDLHANFLPNVSTLQAHGIPMTNIAKLVTFNPRSMLRRKQQFKVIVESIAKMGFDPSSTLFIRGVYTVSSSTSSTWEKKMDVYRSFGWSEEEIILAFSKHPYCMVLSVEKIRQMLQFYAVKMHWGPSFLAARPVLICLSLEKRVIARCLVMSVLVSKGLETRSELQHAFLKLTDKRFEERYVTKHADQAPEILKIYKGDMKLKGST